MNDGSADAVTLADGIRSGAISAEQVVTATLGRIQALDPSINSFTTLFTNAALAQAAEVDRAIAQGRSLGALAGVPFAVKHLFDLQGYPTLAGSKINASDPPARQDATAVAALKRAGAILIGTLNMDEYAYGLVTENAHYGVTRNPHDLRCIAGGSSGGSAAAVAAGLVPITLGSDTNGSVRVPAALCGIYGFKPTYGRISRAGVFPLAHSFDHVGLFGRSVQDLATTFDLLQGADARDPVCTTRPPDLCLPEIRRGLEGVRLAIAEGYFQQGAKPEVLAVVEQVAGALKVTQSVTIPEADRARAAAFLITAAEGGHFHHHRLRQRAQDFDPATRDRFLAGLLVPSHWYLRAQRFRRWYRDRLRELFQGVDVLLTPTTPCGATPIGQTTELINGEAMPVRANLGIYTQPISFVGLPALSIPLQRAGALPLGVQLIAAPYQESKLLRVAYDLEQRGMIQAAIARSSRTLP